MVIVTLKPVILILALSSSRAFDIKEEALERREETVQLPPYPSWSELEKTLMETLSLVKIQAVSSAQNIAEIKTSLQTLEDKIGMLEDKADSQRGLIKKVQRDLTTVKSRQEQMTSEVRLISLHKMVDQTSYEDAGRDADLIVDGQFIFDKRVIESIQTYPKTNNSPNNKLTIHLGGLFRIHRVKVWNVRFCCQDRFVGTRIFADDEMIGVAVSAKPIYQFDVPEGDPTYAREIILHQELAQHLHILEVQVWGSGPYDPDDLFA